MSRLRIAIGRASMRWFQRWPMRFMMEQIFSKSDAIDLPNYKIDKSTTTELRPCGGGDRGSETVQNFIQLPRQRV